MNEIRNGKHDKQVSALGLGASFLAVVACTALMTKCSAEVAGIGYDKPEAMDDVIEAGYSDPRVDEVNTWFAGLQGCDKYDNLGFEITALTDDGRKVALQVCLGMFGDPEIRHQRP